MFRTSTARLRALLALVEDVLGDPEPPPAAGSEPPPATDSEPPLATHPHRRAIRIERARRPGAVAPRPAHCLCPVHHRPGAPRAGRPRSPTP